MPRHGAIVRGGEFPCIGDRFNGGRLLPSGDDVQIMKRVRQLDARQQRRRPAGAPVSESFARAGTESCRVVLLGFAMWLGCGSSPASDNSSDSGAGSPEAGAVNPFLLTCSDALADVYTAPAHRC